MLRNLRKREEERRKKKKECKKKGRKGWKEGRDSELK